MNGTMILLSEDEKLNLLQSSNVKKIIPLNRSGKISFPPDDNIERDFRSLGGYTYGLEKMNLPKVNSNFPDIQGQGVRVGIIDTGIDPQHPDLRGKTLSFRDFVSGKTFPYDNHGHGTHVAGCIAGGKASGKQIGIAPQAHLIVAKTFSKFGGFKEEDLLLALQWMADPDGNPETQDAAHVVSGSWNVDGNTKELLVKEESFCVAIDNLYKLGIYSVFSAGNDGPDKSTIKIPGASPKPSPSVLRTRTTRLQR